uniref:HAT C-terminal dimerisation domain-containing protein n=1 Tax=Latimeria chalumnae TaxID=7897 RepID=H3A7Z0_LATCH
ASKLGNVSAKDRSSQYKNGTFHVSGDMFCSAYNIAVDHKRKATCDRHLEASTHLEKKKKMESAAVSSSEKQGTVKALFGTKTAQQEIRKVVLFNLVEAFTSAYLPLNALDNPALHSYLEENLKSVGVLPTSQWLHSEYFPKVFNYHIAEVKKKLADAISVSVVCDETTDVQDCYVLNVLAVPSLNTLSGNNALFLKLQILKLSQAVLETLQKFDVPYTKVYGFVTDNAMYYEKSLKHVFLNGVHVTCSAHLLNLLGDIWRENFDRVTDLVFAVKKAFTATPARKAQFKQFLKEHGKSTALPPLPVITRWNTWFHAVFYHAEHLHDYISFFLEESTAYQNVATLSSTEKVVTDTKEIALKAPPLVQMLEKYEGDEVKAHVLYDELLDFATFLECKGESSDHQATKNTMVSCAKKIQDYMAQNGRFHQSAAKFFEAVRVFSPARLSTLALSEDAICSSIPAFEDNVRAKAQLRIYMRETQCHQIGLNERNIIKFWQGNAECFPDLSYIVISCLSVPVHSANAERSFSRYAVLLADNRRSIKPENLRVYSMLQQNKL